MPDCIEAGDASGEEPEIHIYGRDKDNCDKCHDVRKTADTKVSVVVFLSNSEVLQTANCMKCHPRSHGDHPVLIQTSLPIPRDLPLSRNYEITCMTCHNTHYLRYSDRPWIPRSYKDTFIDFVEGKKVYKTYYLRRNNSENELCIACHSGVRHQRGYK